MLKYKASFISLLTLLGVTSLPSEALAGPFLGVGGVPGTEDYPPSPYEVPGKEYSNYLDRQGHPNQGVLDPGQVVDWDANPVVPWGTKDGTDFSDLWSPTSGDPIPDPFEVDALANKQDFWGPVLLFSTGETGLAFNNVGGDTVLDDHILYERKAGPWDVWASPTVIDQVLPDDVDGLEVWAPINPDAPLEERINQGVRQSGAEGIPDANRYSLFGDPLGCSIFDSFGNCVVTTIAIADAINEMDYFGFTLNAEEVDLDGLLFYEDPVSAMVGPDEFSSINIEFSLAPIDGNDDGDITFNDPTLDLDGGEIFVWNFADLSADFLYQGGHLWDTEFSVQGKFGTGSENVDALERVATTPEPTSTLGFLAFGILGARSALRRKGNK